MSGIKSFVLGRNINSFTGKLLLALSYLWLGAIELYSVLHLKEVPLTAAVLALLGITVFVVLRAFVLILESVLNALYYISGTQKELYNYMGQTQNTLNEISRTVEETSVFFKRVETKLDLNIEKTT